MILREYLKSLSPGARADFASRCETSVEYLWQIANRLRTPKVHLVISISRQSAGAVTCETLLPDVDWAFLRSSAAKEERAA